MPEVQMIVRRRPRSTVARSLMNLVDEGEGSAKEYGFGAREKERGDATCARPTNRNSRAINKVPLPICPQTLEDQQPGPLGSLPSLHVNLLLSQSVLYQQL